MRDIYHDWGYGRLGLTNSSTQCRKYIMYTMAYCHGRRRRSQKNTLLRGSKSDHTFTLNCTIIILLMPTSRKSFYTPLIYNSYAVRCTYHLTNPNEVYKKEDRHSAVTTLHQVVNLFSRCKVLKQACEIPWPDPLSDHSRMNIKHVSSRH